MRAHLKLAVPLAMLTLALTACAQQDPAAPGSNGAGIPTAPASSASASPNVMPPIVPGCAMKITVTKADNGKTLCLSMGGTVTVDLPPGATSSQNRFDLTGTSLKAGAADGVFTAVSSGKTEISTQVSNCPSPSPGTMQCHSVQLWKVLVVVK